MSDLDTRKTPPSPGQRRSVSERVRPWVVGVGLVALLVIVWAGIPGVEGTGEPVEPPAAVLPPAEGPVLLLEVVDGIEFVMVGGRADQHCVDLNLDEPFPRYLGEACGGDALAGAIGGATVEVRGVSYLAAFGVAPMETISVLVLHPGDERVTQVTPRGTLWMHVESLPTVPPMAIERHVAFVNGRGDPLGSEVVRVETNG